MWGGIPVMSSGSTTAYSEEASVARMGCFSPSSPEITRPSDSSLPVPEVVGTTIRPGAGFISSPWAKRRMGPSLKRRMLTALPVSMAEPGHPDR